MHIPVAPKTRTRKWPESEDASCDLNSTLGSSVTVKMNFWKCFFGFPSCTSGLIPCSASGAVELESSQAGAAFRAEKQTKHTKKLAAQSVRRQRTQNGF